MKNDKWIWLLVVVAVGGLVMALWWPNRTQRLFWENAMLVNGGAANLMEINGLNEVNLMGFNSNQAPVYQLAVAGLWKLFGQRIEVTRLLSIPSAVLILLGIWGLLKRRYGGVAGVVGLALMGMSSVFISSVVASEWGMLATGLAITGLWLWVEERKVLAVMLLGVAIMSQPSLIGFSVCIGYWIGIKDKAKMKLLAVSVIPVLIWLVFVNMSTGSWLPQGSLNGLASAGIAQIGQFYSQTAILLVFWHLRWIPVLISLVVISIGLFFREESEPVVDRTIVGLLIGALTHLGVVGVLGNLSEFSLLPTWGLLVMAMVMVVYRLNLNQESQGFEWKLLAGGLVVGLVFVFSWRPSIASSSEFQYVPKADLQYQDLVFVFTQAMAYVDLVGREKPVFAAFPEFELMVDPIYGYVSRAVEKVYPCSEFDSFKETGAIVMVHLYHSSQVSCARLISGNQFVPVVRYEHNGSWVQIFQYVGEQQAEDQERVEN